MKEALFSVHAYSTSNVKQKSDLQEYKADFERLMSEFRELGHIHEESYDWTRGLAVVALAFARQRPIGFYLLTEPEQHGAALNRTIFVEKQWRGNAISEILSTEVEVVAVRNGIKAIEAHPLINSVLLDWYPKNGYLEIENKPSTIFRKKLSPEFDNSQKPLFLG